MEEGTPRSKGFWKIFGRNKQDNIEEAIEEEILSIVNEGHEQGVFDDSEAEMINNIFEFDDTDSRDIMTHRKQIEGVDSSFTFKELIEYVRENSHSRFPVYEGDIDHIIGVIHIKDLFNYLGIDDINDKKISDIKDLIRTITFVPETRKIDVLFKDMQKSKNHMVVAIDEYGQTSGIITMEDIIEEIVGNIQDEHDEEEISIIPDNDGSFIIDGMTRIDEVCEILDLDEELFEDFDTLNGFIISEIDKIPFDGETYSFEAVGCLFEVLLVEDRIIRTVRVRKVTKEI